MSLPKSLNVFSKIMTDGKICAFPFLHNRSVVTLLHRTKSSLLKQVNQSTWKKDGLHLEIQITSWIQNKTLAVLFSIKYSSLEKGFGGLFVVFCNMCVQLNLGSFQNLYKEGMHGPTSGSPLPHLSKTGELWSVGAAAEWSPVKHNGGVSRVAFWGTEAESGLSYFLFQLWQKHVSHLRKPVKNLPLGITEAPAGRGLRQD